MSIFVISYDLRKPDYTEDDYHDIYAELDVLGAKHIQDSLWAVKSDKTCEDIFDALRQHMHSKDRLLVVQVNGTFKNINGITGFKDV